MWLINFINLTNLIKIIIKLILISNLILLIILNQIQCERVKVKIYDHRAEHDPIDRYGKGPWNYFGYGYGIEYQYSPKNDGTPSGDYERQKGYGYIKKYGRDFCKELDKSKCAQYYDQKSDNNDLVENAKDDRLEESHTIIKNQPPTTHYQDNGVLNINLPNLASGTTTNLNLNTLKSGLIPATDQNNVDYIKKIYNLQKDTILPENVNLNLINKLNPPRKSYLLDNFNLNNKILDGMSSNIKSSNLETINDSNKNNLNINLNRNLENEQNNQPIDQLINKENNKLLNKIKQNSQLIDTSNQIKQPIYLASSHYDDERTAEHAIENSDEHDELDNEHHYESEYNQHDGFSETYKLPKIIHSAKKQLKKHHTNYRSTSNYKNDYEDDNLDLNLFSATRLKPKFIKETKMQQNS